MRNRWFYPLTHTSECHNYHRFTAIFRECQDGVCHYAETHTTADPHTTFGTTRPAYVTRPDTLHTTPARHLHHAIGGFRAWLGFASLHACGIGGHRACLPLRSGSRGIATLRLLPNGSGVSVVLILVDTLWRGTET